MESLQGDFGKRVLIFFGGDYSFQPVGKECLFRDLRRYLFRIYLVVISLQ